MTHRDPSRMADTPNDRSPNHAALPTATELAAAIHNGGETSLEVVERHLERIEAHNEDLNAIVTLADDAARERAKEADAAVSRGESWGPLHGVPVTIKDTYETAGIRTTSSYEPLSDHVPDRDATVVARLREAGAIVLGKTNMAMLAADWQTDSPIFGTANNPWDPERTPGGSSGGSGAAVAAGLTPLGLGSDLGGSVRVPAHFCGIYGLKPTEHRVSSFGHIPDWHIPGVAGDRPLIQHMGTYGPLARSIEDLDLCLSIVEGPDGQDPNVTSRPNEDVSDRPLSDYRFAWCPEFGDVSVSTETAELLAETATRLGDFGCEIETRYLSEFEFDTARKTWGEIFCSEIASGLPLKLRGLFWLVFMTSGRPPIHRGITRGLWSRRGTYQKALTRREQLIQQMDTFLDDRDALLCPVAPTPAYTHQKLGNAIDVDGTDVPYALGAAGFTTIFNLTGHPVVVLPIGLTENGLPVGMQVVGSRWQDRTLLETASALDDVVGGYQRPPLD